MNNLIAPANISHIVLVHAGSYNDFIRDLNAKYPGLNPIFIKRKAVHYYIVQLEDTSSQGNYSKNDIYKLPIMALREEFSKFIFFKKLKSYNVVLKRMCGDCSKEDAPFALLQEMLSPFEKRLMGKLEDANKLEITEIEFVDGKNIDRTTTIFSKDEILSMKTMNKIFGLDTIKLDDKSINFVDVVKDKDWKVGIL